MKKRGGKDQSVVNRNSGSLHLKRTRTWESVRKHFKKRDGDAVVAIGESRQKHKNVSTHTASWGWGDSPQRWEGKEVPN